MFLFLPSDDSVSNLMEELNESAHWCQPKIICEGRSSTLEHLLLQSEYVCSFFSLAEPFISYWYFKLINVIVLNKDLQYLDKLYVGCILNVSKCKYQIGHTRTRTHSRWCTAGTWDVVDLATAVMLQSIAATAAAASTAATVLGTGHSHEAAGHWQLGGLGEVRQDTSRRVGQTSLQGGLRLGSLRTVQTSH